MRDTRPDRVFESKPDAFLSTVYNDYRGDIRIAQLGKDLDLLLNANLHIKSILDIGAGHAPITIKLLEKHSRLYAHLVDPSAALLAKARADQRQLQISKHRLKTTVGDLKSILSDSGRYSCDLIICHAVANWVENPRLFLEQIIKLAVEVGASVSFVFGTNTGKMLRFASEGKLSDAVASAVTPMGGVPSLIPGEIVKPLDPEKVVRWINEKNCKIVFRSGIRILADLVPNSIKLNRDSVDVLKTIEDQLHTNARYWKIAQLAHVIFHPRNISRALNRPRWSFSNKRKNESTIRHSQNVKGQLSFFDA